jgi:B-box zinc finger/Putative zinc finger in N-recognin (UBR box)
MRPERDACRDHPDEEVNYFCFDCLTSPICSECVVHGSHKGHEVATLRKAYPQIMAKTEEMALSLNSKIDELQL